MDYKVIIMMLSFVSSPLFPEAAATQNLQTDYNAEYHEVISGASTNSISNLLMGFNLVYPQESDQIWKDGIVEGYLNDINTRLLRWPGGTVSTFYHWDNLTGRRPPWRDNWDPDNPVPVQPSSNYMDLDQYIDLIGRTGATPLVGINISSGRRWDRTDDGIAEALALMQYCIDNDFEVTYWYLGNEPFMSDQNGGLMSVEEYANLINIYATAMREVNSDIKIIANWLQAFQADGRRNEFQLLLELAGDHIDVIDVHWYWNFNQPTMENWLAQTPVNLYNNYRHTYLDELAYFRDMVDDFGHSDIKLASLEWNIGRGGDTLPTKHEIAMIQSELMMQFIKGGLDMATFHPLHWPDVRNNTRALIDRYDNNKPQPIYNLFKFLGLFQGGHVVTSQITNDLPNVMNLAAWDADERLLRVSFLNKNDYGVNVSLTSVHFEDALFEDAYTYRLIEDGAEHELIPNNITDYDDGGITFTSDPYSITMLTLRNVNLTSIEESYISDKPSRFELKQNYPNPFNPSTVIKYELPENSHVQLEVFDVLGHKVATLINEEQPQGSQNVKFDATGLSSGLYFYRIQAGAYIETKKMLKLK